MEKNERGEILHTVMLRRGVDRDTTYAGVVSANLIGPEGAWIQIVRRAANGELKGVLLPTHDITAIESTVPDVFVQLETAKVDMLLADGVTARRILHDDALVHTSSTAGEPRY